MTFKATLLAHGRWGIFDDSRLLATIGCQQTLDTILTQLNNNQVHNATPRQTKLTSGGLSSKRSSQFAARGVGAW